MADKNQHPEDPSFFELPEEAASFSFEGGEGYDVVFTDFGSGGVKITLYRPNAPSWDKHAAAMLPSPLVDTFLWWMSNRAGSVAMVLPNELLPILQGLIASTKGSKRLPKADREIIKQAMEEFKKKYNKYKTKYLKQKKYNRSSLLCG